MLKQIRKNLSFIIPYIIIIILLSAVLLIFPKPDIHIYMNRYHNSFFDLFFRNVTFLGDGLFVVIVCAVLLIFSFRNTVFFLSTYLGTGLMVQILKRFIFDDALRPVKYFEGVFDLYLVEGAKVYHYLSFPSGHSATAFGFFICIALISDRAAVKLLALFSACMVAYSRIYLSSHFLVDVYAGSLIGFAGALIFYNIVYLSQADWLDYSVLKLIRNKR